MLLEAQALTCIRDRRILFKSLSFTVAPGSALQISGANGAGKTSLLRILCGLSNAQEGAVYWQGAEIQHCRAQYYAELLYLSHSPGLKEELSALENLRFYQALFDQTNDATLIEQALEQVGLYGFEDVLVRNLSAGQRRRVALARLYLSRAILWILDEPLTAIDSTGSSDLERCFQAHIDTGGSIILTSHQAISLNNLHHLQLE